MALDQGFRGYITEVEAVSLVCEIMRVPAPVDFDHESVEARKEILADVGFKLSRNPVDPKGMKVVRYGNFLRAFKAALEKSPLAAENPYARSEAEHAHKHSTVKKSDLSIEEILKVMDQNLPKYYRSTTEAFLRMKPPGGILRIEDFGRFMRSINLDLPDEKLKELFLVYDKNGSGGLEAWEFIESFGPAINGHSAPSTSLDMGTKGRRREPKHLKEVQLTAEQTRDMIMARLPFHYKSSTKAFLAAKVAAVSTPHPFARTLRGFRGRASIGCI